MTTQPSEPQYPTPAGPQDPGAAAASEQGAEPAVPGEQEAASPQFPAPGEGKGESGAGPQGEQPEMPVTPGGPQGVPPGMPVPPGEQAATPQFPAPGEGYGESGAAGFVPPGEQPPAQIPGYDPKRPIPLPPRTGPPAGSAYGYTEGAGHGQFNLALPQLGTIVSGPAVGSLVAGIGAIFVALALLCLGMFQSVLLTIGATVLSMFCIAAAVLLGVVSLRQVRRSEGEYRGRGMAIAGLVCGGVAALLTLVIGVFVVVLSI